MSDRSEIADRLAGFVNDNELNRPLGGDVTRDEKKQGKPYVIVFSVPVNLDGCITVYGKKFIQIAWQTRYSCVPSRGNLVFESEENATNFLRLAFIEFDDKAMEIPTKEQNGD